MGRYLALVGTLVATLIAEPLVADTSMLIIAHRGASAERPEHTLAAYELAMIQGADYIEPDLVVTRDGVLVSRHENELSETTDVATRPEFKDRFREKLIDGDVISGWFAEDFMLAELRTLRTRERIPEIRPHNSRYDGLYQVPTFQEIVQLVKAYEAQTGRAIGVYPELKHPTFLMQDANIDVVQLLLSELKELKLGPTDPIFIQCFEVEALQRLAESSDYPLVQLVAPEGGPADKPEQSYATMTSPEGLADIALYADAVGANIAQILQPDGTPTSLVANARTAGLDVHAWTLRPENQFLPPQLWTGDDPIGRGCGDLALAQMLARAGVAGVFTDASLSLAGMCQGAELEQTD